MSQSLKAIQHHVLLLQLTIATLHVNKAALQDAKKKVELKCGLRLGPDIHAEPSIIALSQTINRYHPESRSCFVSLPASRRSLTVVVFDASNSGRLLTLNWMYRAIPQEFKASGAELMRGTFADNIDSDQMEKLLIGLMPIDSVNCPQLKYGCDIVSHVHRRLPVRANEGLSSCKIMQSSIIVSIAISGLLPV